MADARQGPAGCSVWGRVVDRAGAAVPGAVIHWVAPGPDDPEVLPRLRFFPFATTDASGAFWAPDLPGGPGILVADLDGILVGPDGGRWSHGTRVTLPLAKGEEVSLAFPHVPQDFSRVRGTISRPDGRVARQWTVVLASPDGRVAHRQAVTDDKGCFEMTRLRPGDYSLVITGSREFREGVQPVSLKGGTTLTATIGLQARPPGRRYSARALCVDENGVPVEGIMVVFGGPGVSAPPVRSGADGVARVEDMPVPVIGATGSHAERFPAGAQMSAPEPGQEPDVLLTMRNRFELVVEVLDADTGEPVPRFNVHVHHEAGMAGDESGTVPRSVRKAVQRGRLLVVAGPAEVRVEAPGYEGAVLGVDIPAEGPRGPVRVRLRARAG